MVPDCRWVGYTWLVSIGEVAIEEVVFADGRKAVQDELSVVIERDADWFIAFCPEVPGANGQGRAIEECRESLADAIALLIEERRRDVAQ